MSNRGRLKKPEADKKNFVNLNTRIPEELLIEVKVFCIRNRITVQDFVKQALEEKLKAKK